MPDLLLELGCEELPASFVRKAYTELQELVEQRLTEASIPFRRQHEPLGTPRRLIIHLADVEERQPDQVKEQRGPALKAAYDGDGNPTPALQGFCRGQGIDVSDVRKEGDYVWFTKTIPGRDTREVLAEAIPQAVRSMTFDKAMRWGAARMRFARPIRWILASLGGTALSFDIEGVAAGSMSRGHRFNNPDQFEVASRDELIKQLKERQVETDPADREKRIREGATAVASGEPLMTEALVDENVFLTEWPVALEGSFKEEYLDLPEPVLITAMAKHERFFPVRGADGKLLNRFISIRNGGEEETVRKGNEWVLNARFNDAKFFYDEDKNYTLEQFLARTTGIVFQEKLGSVRERADRLSLLAAEVARATGADAQEIELAHQAGLLAKADLSTGLVSELPSLQGLIGGEYARREGLPDEVCWAIASHYDLSKNANPDCPGGRTAVRVLVADQLDKLAGYLGLGLAPSGSSDPFGLRRAVTMLIEVAWTWHDLDYEKLFAQAVQEYRQAGHQLDPAAARLMLQDIFLSRYPALMPDMRHDVLDAVVERDSLRPRRIRMKAAAMERLADDTAFVYTATRPINIVNAARNKGIDVPQDVQIEVLDVSRLDSADGEALAGALREAEQGLHESVEAEDHEKLAAELTKLDAPINAFFESTMVMAEDTAVRDARLRLLQVASQALFTVGDFSKIVIEGQ
jgi:glycyl-tRNA synthetase beta chain